MDTYRTAIIGAGGIGCGQDVPDTLAVLTHAHGIHLNPRLELVALVDTNAERVAKEGGRWDAKAYTDIDAMFAEVKPDIVVIATPDNTHTAMLEHVLAKTPKLIVLEKPIATNDAEASRLRALRTGIPVVVNFRRRFDARVQALAKEIVAGTHGTVISASGIYCRGILHNGSHMLDLARFLFGEMLSATALSRVDDFPEGLPTVGGVASFERCPEFHLSCGDGKKYFIFELDILTEKKRFRFTEEGFRLATQDIVADPASAESKILGEERREKTGLENAFPNLYAHAVAVLDGKEEPRATLADALKTHDACMKFAEGIK